jgi:hypothetical protein
LHRAVAAPTSSGTAGPTGSGTAGPTSSGTAGAPAGSGTPGSTSSGAATASPAAPKAEANFALDGVPPGRKAADAASLAPSPTAFSGLTADDVTPVGDVDFSKASVATVTLADGNVITMTGAAVGDKHWVQLKASKDAALDAKTAGRAFDIAGYRFDAIFRPLEQLLVPKETPAAKKGPATTTAGDAPRHPAASKKLLPTTTP